MHEEADTRLLLHARHADASDVHTIVVAAYDTDVLVLLIGHTEKIAAEVFLRFGSGGKSQVFNLSKVSKSLGTDVCTALLGLHAFTGCDSVSAFAGKGKVSAFKLMCKQKSIRRHSAHLDKTGT